MIGIVVFPRFQLLDAAGPISAFEIAARIAGRPPKIRVIAAEAGEVVSSSGVALVAKGLSSTNALHTLVVVGGPGVQAAALCPRLRKFVRSSAQRDARIASVCSGTYVLAEAGLLDGRQATTHWRHTRNFLARFPKVRLAPDRIFVRDGNIWSSAGISAGIDLALAMIVEDHGEEVARATAREMVLYHRRGGGQSQFSSLLELKGADRPLRAAPELGTGTS